MSPYFQALPAKWPPAPHITLRSQSLECNHEVKVYVEGTWLEKPPLHRRVRFDPVLSCVRTELGTETLGPSNNARFEINQMRALGQVPQQRSTRRVGIDTLPPLGASALILVCLLYGENVPEHVVMSLAGQ